MRSKFQLDATVIANEFIDRYMPLANGEYVKVYLYLLRHQGKEVEVPEIADALNHTESDIKRAVAYWIRQGLLIQEEEHEEETDRVGDDSRDRKMQETQKPQEEQRQQVKQEQQKPPKQQEQPGTQEPILVFEETLVSQDSIKQQDAPAQKKGNERPHYTPEQVGRLAGEEDFTQLLYISQKYMNKVFTPRECEVFAYLYDALHMPAELLEYLVEYCVQGEHYSIRYLETVALDWHKRNILTVDTAKQYTASFIDEAFSVMRAFGLNERRPGDAEMDVIRRWFQQWGFTKEIVLEACGRTLKATHSPSFSYADKILSEWKKAGVRSLADVKKLDEKRESRRAAKIGAAAATTAPKPAKNQFHNFEQRNTDYDGMVLERLKQRLDAP
ncbi:MAG: DnaD domain protein [Hungatella sp.]|nr:DnaD domain protein [Hungatella sp.]